MFWTLYTVRLCKHDICASLSLQQNTDGRGPPEGSTECLTVGSIGADDPVLISYAVQSPARRTWIPYGLGALWWAYCCQFIHTNSMSELSAYLHCCLQLLTYVATSQSHKFHKLWSRHVSHSKLTFHRALRTATPTTKMTFRRRKVFPSPPFILTSGSLAASPAPLAMRRVFILCIEYKPQAQISTCISKTYGI